MTKQRPARTEPHAVDETVARVAPTGGGAATRGLGHRLDGPSSPEEAEARHVSARDAWIAAMRQAASGRASDLASLAIAQDAYELASAELERWRSGERVPIAVDADPERHALDVVVNQELAWRHTHEAESTKRPGFFGRIARRLNGR